MPTKKRPCTCGLEALLSHPVANPLAPDAKQSLSQSPYRRLTMSFFSWLEGLFKKVNPQHIAGALAASKQTIDAVGAIEKWTWLPKFDTDVTTAVTMLDTWQQGTSTVEITEALTDAIGLVNSDPSISDKDKAIIAVFVGVAESGLALLG